MGDDDIYEQVANRLGISVDDVRDAHQSGSWQEDIVKRINLEKMRKKHLPNGGPPQSPPARSRPPKSPSAKPAATPAPKPVAAPPILMRHSLRVHFSKFNTTYLPQETIYEMMRNQVVPNLPSEIPKNMIEWCEKNCADFWMPSPPAKPEYIMFASNVDMTLFLTAFGGG